MKPCSFAAVLLLSAACQVDGDFLCGVALDSDPSVFRTCDRPQEVCVCANNSCAQVVDVSDCPSQLRYDDKPFARGDVADSCVKPEDASNLVVAGGPKLRCATLLSDGGAP